MNDKNTPAKILAKTLLNTIREKLALKKILSELCESCLRGEVIFQDQRVCYDCPIGETLKRGGEK